MTAASPWILTRRGSTASRIRLFCLPHAGAGASMFMPWQTLFPSAIEVRGIQLPGRENRVSTPPFRQMKELVSAAADAIAPYLDPPYAFLGCSLGAVVAFELTHHLRSLNAPTPRHLFVASSAAPQKVSPCPAVESLDDDALLEWLSLRYGSFWTRLRDHDEFRTVYLPILRIDLELLQAYCYRQREPLVCPISVFTGSEDATVLSTDVDAWGQTSRAGFVSCIVPGGHLFMRHNPALLVQPVAAALTPPAAGRPLLMSGPALLQ